MGKVKRLFLCSGCEQPYSQWSGRCTSCGEWGTIGEQARVVGSRSLPHPAVGGVARLTSLAPDPEEHRIGTGFPSVDRVLGGGLVPGSVVLLAGAPGIGKSTLLLQLASRLSGAGHSCLLASGEEARGQVAGRASRLGLVGDGLAYVPGRDLSEVLAAAEAERPAVLVVDSIQTIRDERSEALPGGPGQVRGCADALIGLAKETGIALVLVGHVTKDGDLAGPRTLEHAVDVVVAFEGDSRSARRVLTGGKNRFGPEGEVAWFEMGPEGLVETDSGPRLGDGGSEPGCAVTLALTGRRAIAVEVQALVVPTEGPPRRQVSGLDPRRFHIVAAVTDQVTGSRLIRAELFGASGGGLRLDDPGSDLAVAAALTSAVSGRPPPPGAGFVGELSLTGAVRPVPGLDQRRSAAAAAGLGMLFCPSQGPAAGGGDHKTSAPRLVHVQNLREALTWAFGPPQRHKTGAQVP